MPLAKLSDLASPAKTLPSFNPPPRFGQTTFGGYKPQHPSQQEAMQRTQSFIASIPLEQSFRWPWQGKQLGQGLYLDGGFGVGKTHLLAAAFNAFDDEHKKYLSFAELVYVIGALGMAEAKEQLGNAKLYCIDEFELDDPGNTLIVKTFLSAVFERGGWVITTSNTPPEAQGQGRFNATDFKREIQSIAERFGVTTLEGPDYRKRERLAEPLDQDSLVALIADEDVAGTKVSASWDELLSTLELYHPIRYGPLLEGVGVLYVSGAEALPSQNDALRFVHFIDKLYDLKVGLRLAGEVALADLFAPSYRDGAYAKKYYRCLSRISELLDEAPSVTADALAG